MPRPVRHVLSALVSAMLLGACAGSGERASGNEVESQASAAAEAAEAVVLVGAGDIAFQGPGAEATARLLDRIPGTVFTLGDNAYQNGSHAEYATYYHPTWGRHKARTRPVVGNHEYLTPEAAGYFDYFGQAAGDREKGYYAYDAGAHWRVLVINSNPDVAGGIWRGTPQYNWLSAELETHRDKNVLAMWHHPRYSSGAHGDNVWMQDVWALLTAQGADVVLGGHDHHYERFAPVDENGVPTEAGLRSFVMGAGGKNHYPLNPSPHAITAVRHAGTFGVLKLTLRPKSYEWAFVPERAGGFEDAGRSPVR